MIHRLCGFVLCLAGLAAAQSPTPQPNSGTAIPESTAAQINQSANAQKARAILQQAIQALGGPAYLNVQDFEQEGRTYTYNRGESGVGILFWRFWRWPDRERIELTKQRDVVFVHNGDKGYEITFKGTAEEEPSIHEDYMRRQQHSLEMVLRNWFPDPKTALFYDGPAVAEQKPTDSVTLMRGTDSVTLFIDSHTHLPVKKTFSWRDPVDRQKDDEAEVFDGYRLEQGLMTPHSIIRSRNGEIMSQRFITSVKYNVGFPDTMFQATATYDPYKSERKKDKQ